ncbi:MAG TPA: Gfo/Idh/MocA family oxidoreductase [Verrucomicrobiae bacterium]|nr:Gfo/Idh/MocA family oxidoreductase [Verrucomicrobiae bacterium]
MPIEGRSDGAQRRVRLGMVGGGEGAFIGGVHRIAARLDDHYDLVAGALSSEAARAQRSGAALGLDPARSYGSFQDMAAAESKRPDGIEAVAIVTPNHMHAPVAKAFLQAGIHVICDKPLTATLEEAKALADLARRSGRVFAVTYNYTGYPMVRQARAMVADGTLGTIRVVQVEYPQDWLTERIETTGHKQAEWRTDPKRTGAGGSIGDIGTHAFHLASFVSGLELDSVLADLTTFVPGRQVDDNANVLLRFKGGAKGMLWASQVAPGNENALRLRVYGTKGGLTWSQENPNYLRYAPFGEAPRELSRGGVGAGPAAARMTRVPPGHPEGYLEGFANIYSEAAAAIRAAAEKKPVPPEVVFPTVEDGLKGVSFVDAVVRSSRDGGIWTKPA